MAIYRTQDPVDAARFARSLLARGYRGVTSGRRTMPAGVFRTRAYQRKYGGGRSGAVWYGVIYGQSSFCTTPGHDSRKAEAHGLCSSCWAKERYRENETFREQRKAAARAYYAKLTPEQKLARRLRIRVSNKLRRWKAAA